MHVFYLHGFASSPQSTKAGLVAARLSRHGLALHCPDFNEPDFPSLTVTRMIAQTRSAIAALPPGPVVLIGSSLGAFVAVHVATDRTAAPVERLVLLAPALDFGRSRLQHLGPDGLERWRDTDRLDVFHYGQGRTLPLKYAFHVDAAQYDALALPVSQPVLAYQGRRDEAVDPDMVERWARSRPNVTLHMVDDDHQLVATVPRILDEMEAFLGLASS